MRWEDYYGQDVTMERFVRTVTGFLSPFIEAIREYGGGHRGLEAGCAEGLASIYLTHLGYDITAMDINKELISKGRAANDYLRGSVNFVAGDLFDVDGRTGRYDFAFSQGVLEHFSPGQIVLLLNKQLAIAHRVIFSVPSKRYGRRDFGDENLWTYRQWTGILRKFHIVHSFGFLPRKNRLQSSLLFPLHFAAPRMRTRLLKRYFCTQIGFVLERRSRTIL